MWNGSARDVDLLNNEIPLVDVGWNFEGYRYGIEHLRVYDVTGSRDLKLGWSGMELITIWS